MGATCACPGEEPVLGFPLHPVHGLNIEKPRLKIIFSDVFALETDQIDAKSQQRSYFVEQHLFITYVYVRDHVFNPKPLYFD